MRNEALPEEIKRMVSAISSARPRLLSGTRETKPAFLSLVPAKRFSIGVSIGISFLDCDVERDEAYFVVIGPMPHRHENGNRMMTPQRSGRGY